MAWTPSLAFPKEKVTMDWDDLMNIMNEQQSRQQALLAAIKKQSEQMKPGVEFDEYLDLRPDLLLDVVERNVVARNTVLAAVTASQIKFNQAVISMLTDLDYRKQE